MVLQSQTRTKSNSLASQDYCYGIVFMDKNVMAGISAQSSVEAHFDLRLYTYILGHS